MVVDFASNPILALRHIYSHRSLPNVLSLSYAHILFFSLPPLPTGHTHTQASHHHAHPHISNKNNNTNTHSSKELKGRGYFVSTRPHIQAHTSTGTHTASPRHHCEDDATRPNDEIHATAGPGSGRFVGRGRPPAMYHPRLSDSSSFIFLPSHSSAS